MNLRVLEKLNQRYASCPFNPVDREQQVDLFHAADELLPLMQDPLTREALFTELFRADAQTPLQAHLAAKLAESKALVQALPERVQLSIVFAVYKEQDRLLSAAEHPHGEDCIARKAEQMQWLAGNGCKLGWDMLIVDDGCPNGSGRLAAELAEAQGFQNQVQVLFLENAIAQGHPVTQPMRNTSESQKGGAVLLGMWQAAQQEHAQHVVAFTDADLSTNLAQSGLLIDPVVQGRKKAAIGSRRETRSVVVKTGHRNTRGKLFIYLWKGLLQPLQTITDTQCGFKAFPAESVRQLFGTTMEKKFAFDLELLLKTELASPDSISKVPVAWIDSEAASTTTGLQPYLSMLKTVAKLYRQHLDATPDADQLAELIESMTEEQWQKLTEHVPDEIASANPLDFGWDRKVPVSRFRALLTQ